MGYNFLRTINYLNQIRIVSIKKTEYTYKYNKIDKNIRFNDWNCFKKQIKCDIFVMFLIA